jgi:hypothetical protein
MIQFYNTNYCSILNLSKSFMIHEITFFYFFRFFDPYHFDKIFHYLTFTRWSTGLKLNLFHDLNGFLFTDFLRIDWCYLTTFTDSLSS